jgi:flagellar basal-body rod protein FlgB
MNLDTIPLFSMLRGRLSYLNQREKVIAQNVANSDTPGYIGRDLKPFSFNTQAEPLSAVQAGSPTQTNPAHLAGTMSRNAGQWKAVSSPDSETTLDGNQVVLEEQMIKMTEARMNYDAAVGFYQKSLSLLRTAARAPGR